MLRTEINEIGQFIPMHYHFQMLSDESRMTAFQSAIKQVVTPQHKVAELGLGTGVMSFFAAKQGARVWAVEYNPALVTSSRRFLSQNGLSDRVQVFEGDAHSWLPPEPVDLVICEMLHSALLREKQLQVVSAFRDAHRARFGKTPQMLPAATLLGVQPVWQCYDFNGYYAPIPLFQSAYSAVDDCCPCADPVVYKIVDYGNAHVETFRSDVLFPLKKDTNVNALRFITKSLLTMNLSTGQTIDWHSQHIILPLPRLLQVHAGQTMQVRFSYQPGDPIEVSKPVLEQTDVDYVMLNEDLSMKNGPLLSPEQYKTFIFPHMRRLVDFYKKNGVRYFFLDTDGNCEVLIPLFMDAGVDGIWPLERVAEMDPIKIRKKFGKDLRLSGGVDKMEIAKGKEAIEKHLAALVPLIEEGGFIPTIDHLASPDISLSNFKYYMKRKIDLLSGKF